MTDTVRTPTYLTGTAYADGGAPKNIVPQKHRDFVVSSHEWTSPSFVTVTIAASTFTVATAGQRVNNHKGTLNGNSTLSITGAVDGATGYIEVTQDGTGGRTFTLPAGTVLGATTAVNTTASKKTGIVWIYNGSTYSFILLQQA